MTKRALLGSALAALCVPAALLLPHSFTTPTTGGAGPDPAPAAEEWVEGVGYVEPCTEVRRLSFKTDGVLARCPVGVGRPVKEGDVLMVLDNREQQAALALAQRDVRLAQAERDKVEAGADRFEIAAAAAKVEMLQQQVRYYRREHSRHLALLKESAASEAESEQARASYLQMQAALKGAEAELQHLRNFVRPEDRALAEARVCRAQAQRDLARQRFEDTFLRAPSAGTLLEIFKREGEAQRPTDADPVALFADLRRLQVRAEIDERHARRLRAGQKAVALGRGLGSASFPGQIAAVRQVMGKKTVFTRSVTERKDLDVLTVLIDLDESFCAPVGLQVDVRIRIDG
jgi:multidrug resistance efflux pump